jgi:hypothetical protein
MRVFLVSVLAAIVFAAVGLLGLNAVQRASGAAYSTEGARIAPAWSWRKIIRRSADQAGAGPKLTLVAGVNPDAMRLEHDEAADASDACEQAGALRWLFVDFSDTADESGCGR